MVPELRERYLRGRNIELIEILQGGSLTPAEGFWAASERMEETGMILRACLDDHRRSRMLDSLILMYRHQMIGDEDLDVFSEELRERIASLAEISDSPNG